MVGAIAAGGLAAGAAFGWGTETLVVVPSTLVVAVYLLAAVAGARLLTGMARACSVTTIVLTLLVVPAATRHVAIPLVVAALALGSRYVLSRHHGSRLES